MLGIVAGAGQDTPKTLRLGLEIWEYVMKWLAAALLASGLTRTFAAQAAGASALSSSFYIVGLPEASPYILTFHVIDR